MNTRRYPRTMAEAFGPYTSHDLEPMSSAPSEQSHIWATRVLAVILVAVVAAVIVTGAPA